MSSTRMGCGWGRGCRLYLWRRDGSKKLSEVPESTSALTNMGGRWGMRRWTRRERWQG